MKQYIRVRAYIYVYVGQFFIYYLLEIFCLDYICDYIHTFIQE